MCATKKKMEMHMNDLLKLRESEHSKHLQRYSNVKKDIENQQNIERVKRERAFKTRPDSASNNKSMMSSTMSQSKMFAKSKTSKIGNTSISKPASKPSYQ